ncbi:cobalamin-dependent protein [Dehalobacter sp. DCM]|uniref:cobalamin B12-binding domain-containing protein n=1 Tax=Dehalobacter sp. DCM TaxID=2907827 RepID=UPI0030821A27|nr:cobalamin-dependent protein [Dehalobacter sp. DCM]
MEELLIKAVEELNEDLVIQHVNTLLAQGVDVYNIYDYLSKGLQRVGEKYKIGDYYIADLIVSGELIKKVMKLKGMSFPKKANGSALGTVVVGTIYEDIHDVGKDVFISVLKSAGFKTVDLGVDVSSEKFIEAIKKKKPDIVGISGVLTMTGGNIKKVINNIAAAGLREDLFIIVGGASINDKLFKQLGADAYSLDAVEGAKLCVEWMKSKGQA